MSNNGFNNFGSLFGGAVTLGVAIGTVTGATLHKWWTKPEPSVQEYADCIRRCRGDKQTVCDDLDEYNDWVESKSWRYEAPPPHKFFEPCEHHCARKIIRKQE